MSDTRRRGRERKGDSISINREMRLQVIADRTLAADALRIGVALAEHISPATRTAFAGLRRLAAFAGGASVGSAWQAMQKLVERSHFKPVKKGSGTRSTEYEALWDGVNRWGSPSVHPRVNANPDASVHSEPASVHFTSASVHSRREHKTYTEDVYRSRSSTDSKMTAEEWFASAARPAARVAAYQCFQRAPDRALTVDSQIERFAEFNRSKRLTDEEWRSLWERWCQKAVERARRSA